MVAPASALIVPLELPPERMANAPLATLMAPLLLMGTAMLLVLAPLLLTIRPELLTAVTPPLLPMPTSPRNLRVPPLLRIAPLLMLRAPERLTIPLELMVRPKTVAAAPAGTLTCESTPNVSVPAPSTKVLDQFTVLAAVIDPVPLSVPPLSVRVSLKNAWLVMVSVPPARTNGDSLRRPRMVSLPLVCVITTPVPTPMKTSSVAFGNRPRSQLATSLHSPPLMLVQVIV